MPRLQDYIGEREVLEVGKYGFKFTDVEKTDAPSADKFPTVQVKGEINDKKYVIFRYLHPNMLWKVAQELVALGAAADLDIDLKDAEQVAEAYEKFVGQTAEVKVKIREYDGKKSNEFTILGLADGAAYGAV